MLQLVLVMNREFTLSDLALIHTKSLATTDVLIKPPDAGMNCHVEIFSHCVVIFDIETHFLTTTSPAVCIIVSSVNYNSRLPTMLPRK